MKKFFAVTAVIGASMFALAASASAASSCDPLDTRACLMPWPSNHFTAAQKGSVTGLRLDFAAAMFPKNKDRVPAFPVDLNRNDGFSPGSVALTYVPGLDLARSGATPITNLARYSEAQAPIVVIDAKTGVRHPVWAELDTNPDALAENRGKTLMIHGSRNYLEGRRYIVALRNLKNAGGTLIKPAKAFAAIRDKKAKGSLKLRAKALEPALARLAKSGIKRSSLYLAWEFTVASGRNLSERALSMRDRTFKALGDSNLANGTVEGNAPTFAVSSFDDFTPQQDARIARRIAGTFNVPCFIDSPDCRTGGKFSYLKDSTGRFASIPKQFGTMQAQFICRIPRSALSTPARPSVYGHGLLGSAGEVGAGNVDAMASEHNMMFCATPESGMAGDDIVSAVRALGDMSKFSPLADRLQQGLLNEIVLARLMIHAQGFAASDKFKNDGGASVIDRSAVFYDGNSQGGILGGAMTALSPDVRRAVLGVPGMNYSELLPRSTDFDTYEAIFKPAYPSRVDRLLLINVVQTLWDRGENNGYAQHMTSDPLPGTPSHTVLLHVALGDHQVAQMTAEKMARTIGASGRRPVYDSGRSADVTPLWGIPAFSAQNASRSGIVIWDSGPCRDSGGLIPCTLSGVFTGLGGPVAPTDPVPPRLGDDPHEDPRATSAARQQKSDFLRSNGQMVDPCSQSSACRTDRWAQPTPPV